MRTCFVALALSAVGGFSIAALAAGCSGTSDSSQTGADDLTADHKHVDAGPALETTGIVDVLHAEQMYGPTEDLVSAAFYREAIPAATGCAQLSKVGSSCTFASCTFPVPTSSASASTPSAVTSFASAVAAHKAAVAPAGISYLSAGTITAGDPRGSVSLAFDADGGAGLEYPYQSIGYEAVGETLSVRATGAKGGVGAFHTKLTEPTRPTFTSPVAGPLGPNEAHLLITPTDDFAVTWTGGTHGSEVLANLQVSTQPGDGLFHIAVVSCSFDAGDGQGTIPSKGALEHLPSIDLSTAGANGFLSLSTRAAKTVHVDKADVTASVTLMSDQDAHSVITMP